MENQIYEWVQHYASGRLTSAEARELRAWIDCSVENRKQFEQYLRIIKIHRMAVTTEKIDQENSWKQFYQKLQKNNRRRLIRRMTTVAAIVLLLIGVGLTFFFRQDRGSDEIRNMQILPGTTKATLVLANGSQVNLLDEDLKEIRESDLCVVNDSLEGLQYHHTKTNVDQQLFHTIKVPVAGEYNFTLSDGTRVWMNSDSELRFPVHFSNDKREIYLKGEIYLEVATKPEVPFVVYASDVAIEVLGTKFNVASYPEESRVVTTLLQGSVRMSLDNKVETLYPGEQAIANLNDMTLQTRQVDASIYISWIKGIFEYENMPLEEITAQLERWYDVEFVFSATEFKKRRFTGVVKKYDVLNDVLKLIEKTTNVSFVMLGKTISVQEINI